jgi:hypothetical protein
MLRVEDYEELRWLAELAVCKGWSASRRAHPSANPDEVDQTYRLVRWTTRYLGKLWEPVFQRRGASLRISGVFCHKTPLATFDDGNGDKQTCELGDLLVVHDHLGGAPYRRATLMQAKRTLHGSAKAPDAVQNDLYRRRPLFELSRRGYKRTRFKKGNRDIADAADFVRFALVADDATSCFWIDDDYWPFVHPAIRAWRPPWVVGHPAQDPVTSIGAETFGSFLTGMLYETHPARGQAVAPLPNLATASLGRGQDLDITVQELLDLTGKRVAKSQETWSGLPRGIVAFTHGSIPVQNPGNPLAFLSRAPGAGEEPPAPLGEAEEEDDGEGIPILLIETFGD